MDDVPSAPALSGVLDEGLDLFLAALRANAARLAEGDDPSVDAMRESAAALRRPWNEGGPAMRETLDLDLPAATGTLRARLYRPRDVTLAPALVYLHGGGWTLLGIETHDRLMREYAEASGWAVLGLDYPLAPETGYPETVEACLAALCALAGRAASLGLCPDRLVIGGDSSGANLAAALALAARDGSGPPLAGMLLNYGVYDCDFTRPSYARFGAEPYQLTSGKMARFWELYCPDEARRREPLASPLYADLRALPPAHLVIAEQDVLRDENAAFAGALAAAGNAVSLDRYPHAPHAFLEALAFAPVSRLAVRRAAAWLRGLGREPSSGERR